MKRYEGLKWFIFIVALAINIFILVNACINGEVSAAESNSVAHTTANVVNTVKPETVTEQNFPDFAFSIRKLFGHFGLFLLSGFFTTWSVFLLTNDTQIGFSVAQTAISIFVGILFALLSELLQKFTAGRSGNFTDVLIDLVGYLIGIVCMQIINFAYKISNIE